MGREIKFRVWDPNNEQMYENIGINKIYLYDYQGNRITEEEALEIMQYTGLKDRNGKEIYEGDIYEEPDYSGGAVIYGGSQPKRIFVVEYSIENSIGKKAGYNLKAGFENGLHKGEIIGNIYEHPHLLEAK